MSKSYKVLIIEDSLDDLELYKRIILKNFTSDIIHFPSAENALDEILKGNHFDLLLLDYHLPGMSGLDFLKTLKQKGISLDCPKIALTGQGNEEVVVNFMHLGITDYIQKNSINQESLTQAIKKAWDNYFKNKIEQEAHQELMYFAHTLAHDLKSPLGRMKTYAKLLGKNPRKQEEYILNLQEDAAFLMEFIDKLLSFAKSGRSNTALEEVALTHVIHKSLENLELEIRKSAAEILISHPLPTIQGHCVSLVQLFQNLISNSIKYCKTQPHIIIETTIETHGTKISLWDNGIGIPEHEIENAFKPLNRIQNDLDVQGTGLGLALVKNIIDQHHGQIKITPRPEGGTRFDLHFPG